MLPRNDSGLRFIKSGVELGRGEGHFMAAV